MLEVNGQERGSVLEVTTQGTATQEDLKKFQDALKDKTLQEEPVNILFVFKNIEGITPKGLLEDFKVISYLKSIKKSAVVSDETFMRINAARKWVED